MFVIALKTSSVGSPLKSTKRGYVRLQTTHLWRQHSVIQQADPGVRMHKARQVAGPNAKPSIVLYCAAIDLQT
jgi:hypothetical protein